MGDMTWTGTKDDREFTAGNSTHYVLGGSAEQIIGRLQQIIDDHPDLDPRDIRGQAMVMVLPGITEVEAEQLAHRDD